MKNGTRKNNANANGYTTVDKSVLKANSLPIKISPNNQRIQVAIKTTISIICPPGPYSPMKLWKIIPTPDRPPATISSLVTKIALPKAIRKLRHPSRSKKLSSYMEN